MTKYARKVRVDDQIRLIDVFDADSITPRPTWGLTDDALLSKIFENHRDEWISKGEWFVEVPDDALPGAVENKDGGYTNPAQPAPEPVQLSTEDKIDLLMQAVAATSAGAAVTLGVKVQ